MWCGPNDGGIKRGDRADTGDLEARHKDGVGEAGSGVSAGSGGATGHSTAVADSMEEPVDVDTEHQEDRTLPESAGDTELDDLTIKTADDPTLGLTNIGGVPADDWAADTGPDHGPGERLGNPATPRKIAHDKAAPKKSAAKKRKSK